MSPRSKTQLAIVALLVFFSLSLPLMAEPEIHFDGQVRARQTIENTYHNIPNIYTLRWTYLRTRLGISARIENNTNLYVQFQDSRLFGAENQFDSYQSGTLNDSKNVDIHQAYLQIDHIWNNGPGFKAGRFEVNYGNQRVFGSYDWDNVGRSWEGMIFWIDRPSLRIDLLWLDVKQDSNGRNFDIYGIFTNPKKLNTQLFVFYELDGNRYIASYYYRLPKNTLDRINLGLYHRSNYKYLDFTANGAYQFGNKYAFAIDTARIYQDISAFLITFEAGFTFDIESELRIAAGIDYSSGDGDIFAGDYTVYQNSYYSGHKFRGYMDYFVNSDYDGLLDSYLHGGFIPLTGWTVQGDLHYFRTDKKFQGLTGASKNIGLEFDLTVNTTRIAGVLAEAGASVFFPSEEYARSTNPRNGYWLYAMLTADFYK